MGACNFTALAHGKTAAEAFNTAVSEALYMHGHGGYTGTIAEKHEFIMIRDTVSQVVARLEAELKKPDESYGAWRHGAIRDLIEKIGKSQKAPEYSIVQALEMLGDERISDKWGPAGCIDCGNGTFLFFGYASS